MYFKHMHSVLDEVEYLNTFYGAFKDKMTDKFYPLFIRQCSTGHPSSDRMTNYMTVA